MLLVRPPARALHCHCCQTEPSQHSTERVLCCPILVPLPIPLPFPIASPDFYFGFDISFVHCSTRSIECIARECLFVAGASGVPYEPLPSASSSSSAAAAEQSATSSRSDLLSQSQSQAEVPLQYYCCEQFSSSSTTVVHSSAVRDLRSDLNLHSSPFTRTLICLTCVAAAVGCGNVQPATYPRVACAPAARALAAAVYAAARARLLLRILHQSGPRTIRYNTTISPLLSHLRICTAF